MDEMRCEFKAGAESFHFLSCHVIQETKCLNKNAVSTSADFICNAIYGDKAGNENLEIMQTRAHH